MDFEVLLGGTMGLIQDDLKAFALQQMEAEGLVEARDGAEYTVTSKGLERLREWDEQEKGR
jgi:predicted transcriptional regulator